MNLLVLGGTGFIGPHLVRHAVARGHRVTIFTRGRREGRPPRRGHPAHGRSQRRPQVARGEELGRRHGRLGDQSRLGPPVDGAAEGRTSAAISSRPRPASTTRISRAGSTSRPGALRGRRSEGRLGDVRRRQGEVRAARADRLRRPRRGRPSDVHRRSRRHDRPIPATGPSVSSRGGEVLAPGPARRPRAVHRRPRPRRVHGAPARGRPAAACTTPSGPQAVDDHAGIPRSGALRRRLRRQVHLRRRLRVPREAQDRGGDPLGDAQGQRLRDDVDPPRACRRPRDSAYRPVAATVRDTLAWWPTVPEARRKAPKFAITPSQEAEALAAWHARKRESKPCHVVTMVEGTPAFS